MAKNKKPTWRNELRDAMKTTALKEAQEKSDSKKPPFRYRWEHVCAVVETAVKLGELVKADLEVVEASAWLHDIAKWAGDLHPIEGAKVARKMLPKTDFPPKKIKAVARAIEDHMGLWRDKPLTNLESQVLWDADKLTKIGVLAAFQWTAGALSADKKTTTESIINRLNSAEWRSKTVASMHTTPAKQAAKSRFAAYDALVSQLETEWKADDLKV